MYYSYVEIEDVATSFSSARTDLALKLLKQETWDILICVIFHRLIFTGVTLYQPLTVRCDISTGINAACVSGTNFSDNCVTMASSEHGCVQDDKDLHRQV